MSCDYFAATWLIVHIRTSGTRKCDPFDQTLSRGCKKGLCTRLVRYRVSQLNHKIVTVLSKTVAAEICQTTLSTSRCCPGVGYFLWRIYLKINFVHVVIMYMYMYMYRTNLPKEIMLFPDFPFPSDLPSFPYHHDVYQYLTHYSQHFKLNRFIKFGTLVEQIVPIPILDTNDCCHGISEKNDIIGRTTVGEFRDSVQWSVTTRELASGQKTTEVYDNIFLCNG